MSGRLIGKDGRLGRDAPGNTGRLIKTPYPMGWNYGEFKGSSGGSGTNNDLKAVPMSTLWAAAVANLESKTISWTAYASGLTQARFSSAVFDESSSTRNYVTVTSGALAKSTANMAGERVKVLVNVATFSSAEDAKIKISMVASLPTAASFLTAAADFEFDVTGTGELLCDCSSAELDDYLIVWPHIVGLEPPSSYGRNTMSINTASEIIIDP
jgi:hypothetical protein